MNGETLTAANNAHLDFKIVNNGTNAQSTSPLELRYWYLNQGVLTNPTVDCYYVSLGSCPSAFSAGYNAYTPHTNSADTYMQLSFTALSIPAGGTFEIHLGLHNVNYSGGTWDETKNYSFTAADTSFGVATNVGLYQSGTLIWGMLP